MQSPLNQKTMSKATVIGVSLSVGGIVLFIVLYVLLGNAGMEQFPRIALAVCAPPTLMAALLGGYFLLTRPKSEP